MISINQWLFCGLVAFLVVFGGVMGVLGAWLVFRVRTIGTGYTLMRPGAPVQNDGKVHSYVSDLYDGSFDDLLKEPELSEDAQRLRDQKGPFPSMEDVLKEVQGK